MLALGERPVLMKRRSGNVVLAGSRAALPVERLRARAAADPWPAWVLGPDEIGAFIGGAPPLRD